MRKENVLISLGIFFCFVFLFAAFFHPTTVDYDLGRHLLFGKIMLETDSVIKTNLISFSNTNFNYVNSHWLSEIIFFIIFKFLSFNGLILFTVGISSITFFMIFLFALKRFSALSILLSSVVCVRLMSSRTEIRPEIFSYFFLSIFLVILYKFRENGTKLIFLLIPLEALWVNLHINFIIGIILPGLFLLDNLIENKFKLSKKLIILLIVFVSLTISSLFNPSFVKGAIFPLTFYKNYALPVQENTNLFLFLSDRYLGYIPLLGIGTIMASLFFLLFYYRKKIYTIDWLLVFVFSLAFIYAVRNISLFAYAIFIPLTRILTFLPKDLQRFLDKNLSQKKLTFLKRFTIFFIFLTILGSIVTLVEHHSFGFGVIESGKNAIEFYKKNALKGPVYNNFNSGEYLAYRLYPQEKVFVDARPEAYPNDFFLKTYIPLQLNPTDFKKVNQKYNFNVIFMFNLFESHASISYFLNNPNYKLIYLDDISLIFLKNNNQNKKIIDSYLINEKSFIFPKIKDEKQIIGFLGVFDKMGWIKQERIAYGYLHEIDPTDCYLKNNLSLYAQKDNVLKNIKVDLRYKCLW